MSYDRLSECPLCGADAARARRLAGYEKDHIGRCAGCGFVYSLLEPNAEDYARVYGAYDYAQEDAGRTDVSIQKERALAERLSSFRKTGKVLDVAAGAGRFLAHFRDLGFTCFATEFSEPMCAYLEEKGFTAYRGGLMPEGAPEGAFDLIVFTEIIEHINNPHPVLRNLYRLLRPGGGLFLTTPNWNSLERRLFKGEWGMLAWPEHITYWTTRTTARALTDAGFRKQSLRAQNISPYRIMQALKRRGFAAGTSEVAFSDAAQQAVARNPLLRLAKRAVNGALVGTGLGSSIEAVYVKPDR